jgi:hypothetical protein
VEAQEGTIVGASKAQLAAPGPFAESAQVLRAYGLAVLPLGREGGKEPLVSFGNWSFPPGADSINKLITKHGNVNIGIVCHLSGVTVVDIDDPSLVEAMLERFGPTPLRTRTPSGGVHLWYRHNGERNRNLRASENLDVDIKGFNGIIAVPPSIRPDGEHAGKAYEFISGSWDDLPNLPLILRDALNSQTLTALHSVGRGRRNDMLFRSLLREAHRCDEEEDLIDVARTINDDFPEPLPAAEVVKTAKSAWDYEVRGENWAGREARFPFTKSTYDALKSNSDALNLFTCLHLSHGARKEPIAVSPKAMHRDRVIPGWGVARYTNARNMLEKLGGLKCIHKGGKGPGDPSMFTLGIPGSP